MLLGVDIGTTAVKAVLVDKNKRLVAAATHTHQLLTPQPGFAEENPSEWWIGVTQTVRSVQKHLKRNQKIQAIGVTGMVPALVLHDAHGRILRPSIQQNDARAVREMEELKNQFGDTWLFERTGVIWNQQVLSPKLLWLKRREPNILARTRWISGSYEHISYKLTNQRYQEANWALESGLYDYKSRCWIKEILDYVGITRDVFQEVLFPWEIIGNLTPTAARHLGLTTKVRVIAGSADHVASVLAVGLTQPGDAVIKLGGAGDFLFVHDVFAPIPELFIDFHDIPNLFLINGCMATSGTLLKWFRETFAPSATYAELDEAAAEIPPGAVGLVVLPYFLGEKTPIHDPKARGTVVGLTLSHSIGHIWRALLEGVAYAFRHHIEVLIQHGYKINRLFITDGGARSLLWRKIIASVLNSELYYTRGGEYSSAYGAAILAGCALELWNWKELSPEIADITTPIPEWTEVYEELYIIYRQLYQRLKDLYPMLGGAYGQRGGDWSG